MIPSLPKISYSLANIKKGSQPQELAFFSLTCIGIIHAIALFAIGMVGTALTMALLSGACAFAAQTLQHVSLTNALKEQVLSIRDTHTQLTKQNLVLQTNIDDFANQIGIFSLERQHYQTIITQLKTVADKVSGEKAEFLAELTKLQKQVSSLETLQTTILPSLRVSEQNGHEQLRALRELVEKLSDPTLLVQRYEELRIVTKQLAHVTERLEETEKLLTEKIQKLNSNDTLLREMQREQRLFFAAHAPRKEDCIETT